MRNAAERRSDVLSPSRKRGDSVFSAPSLARCRTRQRRARSPLARARGSLSMIGCFLGCTDTLLLEYLWHRGLVR